MDNLKIYQEKAQKLKAIAHPHRLCIIKGLMEKECNVGKIQECLQLPQSTISQYLAKLRDAGLIEGKRNGNEICYSVKDKEVIELIKILLP